MRLFHVPVAWAAASIFAFVRVVSAVPTYNIVPLGFDDLEHTRDDGYKQSTGGYELNEAGQTIGYSLRFNGGSADLGQSAWLYDGATTMNIGLTGAEHTRFDGYKYSDAFELNEAVGSSRVDLQACKLEYSIVSPK